MVMLLLSRVVWRSTRSVTADGDGGRGTRAAVRWTRGVRVDREVDVAIVARSGLNSDGALLDHEHWDHDIKSINVH